MQLGKLLCANAEGKWGHVTVTMRADARYCCDMGRGRQPGLLCGVANSTHIHVHRTFLFGTMQTGDINRMRAMRIENSNKRYEK